MALQFSKRTLRKWRLIAIYVGISIPIASFFSFAISNRNLESALHGIPDGALVTLGIAIYVQFFSQGRVLKQLPFVAAVAFHSCMYVLCYVMGIVLAHSLGRFLWSPFNERIRIYGDDPVLFWTSDIAQNYLYGLVLVFLVAIPINFVLQMNRLVGQNVLFSFLTGRYRNPTVEHRVFMFLDLAGSTGLAEKLGDAKFLELLRDFFDEITDPLLETQGEIYKYMGDEIILSWPRGRKNDQGDWIEFFYYFEDKLQYRRGYFMRTYDEFPEFRAAVHAGKVSVGEIGDIKQEIAYVGDVLNTTARLEEFAKERGVKFVASSEAIECPCLPDDVSQRFMDEFQPRGKMTEVSVYEIERSSESKA